MSYGISGGMRGLLGSMMVLLLAANGVRADDATAPVAPIRALLVIGGCCHDYAKQKTILTEGIGARAHIVWTIAYDADRTTRHLNPIYQNPNWAKGFDIIVHDECSADVADPAIIGRILQPHRDGLPAVVLHCGMHCYRSAGWQKIVTPWFEFTGLQSTGHGAQRPIAMTFVDKANPITLGMKDWTTMNEELYNNAAGKLLDPAHALARGKQTTKGRDGKETTNDCVMVWTNLYHGKARVFATTLGHNNNTVADPRYLDLLTRGLLWTCGKLDDRYLKPFDASKHHFSWEPKPMKTIAEPPRLDKGK